MIDRIVKIGILKANVLILLRKVSKKEYIYNKVSYICVVKLDKCLLLKKNSVRICVNRELF